MTSHQLNIHQKSKNIFNNNLIIALTIHLLFICFITVRFNEFPTKKITNIAFLGAILDPLETDRIKTQNNFSVKNTLNLPAKDQQHNGNTATALTKPHLNQNLNQNHKTLFKSPPEQKNPVPKIIHNMPIASDEYPFLPQPYQHLKL